MENFTRNACRILMEKTGEFCCLLSSLLFVVCCFPSNFNFQIFFPFSSANSVLQVNFCRNLIHTRKKPAANVHSARVPMDLRVLRPVKNVKRDSTRMQKRKRVNAGIVQQGMSRHFQLPQQPNFTSCVKQLINRNTAQIHLANGLSTVLRDISATA
jgi:hypothetical protein